MPNVDGTRWRSFAVCISVDAAVWFPGPGGTNRPAQRICAGCPVRAACLDYALRMRISDGVWGGLTPAQRRALLRRQVTASAA